MVIKTNIAGVISRLNGLPREINREISKGSGEFMRSVQKSARKRAPRDTKELSKSIVVTKTKSGWDLIVASKQGFYQEMGFKPHWIHSDQIEGSTKLKRKGFFFVKKSKPFVRPALEKNLSNLSNILSKSTKQAIQNARRWKCIK